MFSYPMNHHTDRKKMIDRQEPKLSTLKALFATSSRRVVTRAPVQAASSQWSEVSSNVGVKFHMNFATTESLPTMKPHVNFGMDAYRGTAAHLAPQVNYRHESKSQAMPPSDPAHEAKRNAAGIN